MQPLKSLLKKVTKEPDKLSCLGLVRKAKQSQFQFWAAGQMERRKEQLEGFGGGEGGALSTHHVWRGVDVCQ